VRTFGKPAGEQVTVAVFTTGSGSPARTVRLLLMNTFEPGATLIAWLIPSSGSVTVPTQFGLSAELVLVTVIW
jgi:hypothetical protein